MPAAACPALIVVDGNAQKPVRADQVGGQREGFCKVARVMQYAPAVDNVELAKAAEILSIQGGPLLDRPRRIARQAALLERFGARDGLGIVVERVDRCAQSPGRQAEQPAAGPDVEKRSARQVVQFEQPPEGGLGVFDPLVVQGFKKRLPIGPERESLLFCEPVGVHVGVHECLSSDFATDIPTGNEASRRIVGLNFFQGKRNPPSRLRAPELPGSPASAPS